MRCLLVDDEDGIREGLAALLRLRGHEVRTAADRATAQSALAASTFDLVLTDWRLPDGDAGPLIEQADCPVVAVSGHPDEVRPAPRLHAVLGKPILPTALFALLEQLAPAPAPRAGLDSLPVDVRAVLDVALRRLDAARAQVLDDGRFVTLRAPWPGDHLLPEFTAFGGDLRILAPGAAPLLELRWLRDGRPDPALPVVAPGAPWPESPRFAVDFHDTAVDLPLLADCVARAARHRRRGQRALFLNVPAGLRAAIAGSDQAADLPMREPIGPRIPAVLADLWS